MYIYIATSFLTLSYVVFESTLLNYANPCTNLTFQRFARLAEKKERYGTNKKYDTRLDLNPGPRLVAPMLYLLSYDASGQNTNFLNPISLQISNSFRRFLFLMWTCCLVNSVSFLITVHC